MPRSIIASALVAVLAALTLTPAAESAGSLAKRVAAATKLAKAADRKATTALARTAPVGTPGAAGRDGIDGQTVTGLTGAQGAAGAKGDTGARGLAGEPGQDAPPRPAPVSRSNQSVVAFDAVTRTPAVTLSTEGPGQAVLLADAESRPVSSGDVTCVLRVDGSTVEERMTTLDVSGVTTLAFHSPAGLGAGAHDVDLACSGPARVGALGARLTVMQ